MNVYDVVLEAIGDGEAFTQEEWNALRRMFGLVAGTDTPKMHAGWLRRKAKSGALVGRRHAAFHTAVVALASVRR